MKLNEFDQLSRVAIRDAAVAFESDERLDRDWEKLRFHSRPQLAASMSEYRQFRELLQESGAELIDLAPGDDLTLDSIYPRDSLIVSPKGLILCNMGRASRQGEVQLNAFELQQTAKCTIAGIIELPGTIEGGDVIWLDEKSLAVGLGPRTNREGIAQLQSIVGDDVEVFVVPLPAPGHPDDVFHLMSMISPLDADLVLIYRPLMPAAFIEWLEARDIGFVEVPDEEFPAMACNVLATAPRKVIMLSGLPVTLERLQQAGCNVATYTGDHISRKGEGGPTCLTRPLTRI